MFLKFFSFQILLATFLYHEVLCGCSPSNNKLISKNYTIDDNLLPYLNSFDAMKLWCAQHIFNEDMSKYVIFYHYTKINMDAPKEIKVNSPNILSEWINGSPVRILIHGFTEDSDSPSIQEIMKAYLKNRNYNIIAVDWSEISQSFCYALCVSKVDAIGKYTAKLIKYLIKSPANVKLSDIQLIGHSLGAHIAGAAGKYMGSQKIPVIYGLDPAGPLFRNVDVKTRLDPTDAEYVEAIHTDAQDGYGIDENVGHVDFYVNGGCNQPECTGHYIRYYLPVVDTLIYDSFRQALNICSHSYSVTVFSNSLNSILKHSKTDFSKGIGLFGTECDSIEDAFNEKCPNGPRTLRRFIGASPNYKYYGIYQVITTQ